MEFFGNILPILIFILIAISKSKKTTQRGKPVERRNIPQEAYPKTKEQKMKKTVISKDYKSMAEMLRKEINTVMGEIMEGNEGSLKKKNDFSEDTIILEDQLMGQQHIEAQKKKFQKKIDTPGIQVDEEIQDIIRKKEIGRRIRPIRNNEMVRGIILSEVLGKPKAIKR